MRDKKTNMDDTEIMLKGIEALNDAMGAADALRFLSLTHHGRMDYVKISQRIYKNQTIDQIRARAKKNWKARPPTVGSKSRLRATGCGPRLET